MTRLTHSVVELVDHMGSDVTVVNAARVSFSKHHDTIEDNDPRLIKYLAEHDHWTCFGHCFATFRIKAPIFVARQLAKHTVGLCWNEESRRYIDDSPDYYQPTSLRTRPKNIKQGSSTTPPDQELNLLVDIQEHISHCDKLYRKLVEAGVAPEQARVVLPLNTMTEWLWSGSLAAWGRVVNLRLDDHTQLETQHIAYEICAKLLPLFPISMDAIRKCKGV